MKQIVLFALLGLGQGAMYAGLATGLVVTYRGSGVVNLAYTTMAAYPAMAYHALTSQGRLILPWVIVPADFKVAERVAPIVAFPLAVALGVLLGVIVQFGIFRPLRYSSALSRLVVTVGLTVVLQAIGVFRFGRLTRRPRSLFPESVMNVLGGKVPKDRLWLALITVVMVAVVWLILNRTVFGLATRAAAESEKGAVLLGLSPDSLAFANAVLAAVIGAISGILLSSIAGVSPFSFSFFVVPALAGALSGRLRSLGVTALVAMTLGMFQAVLVRIKSYDWIPSSMASGFDEGLPFLVIVVVLAAVGKNLPTRGTLVEAAHTRAVMPRNIGRWALVGLVSGAAVLLFADRTLRLPLIISLGATVVLLAQVVLSGYLGQISLAQLTFAGVGAYTLAKLTTEAGWSPLVAAPVSVLVPTVVGFLVSIPALRIRGVQLALVTLAFAIAAEQLVFRNSWFSGPAATAIVASPKVRGIDFGILGEGEFPQRPFGLIVLVVSIACMVLVSNVRRSGTGRRFLAVRANERAAAAAGINVAGTKLTASVIASFLAGVSGVLLGYTYTILSPTGFESRFSLSILAIGFLGGIGRVSGALLAGGLVSGGIVFALVESITNSSTVDLQFLLSGVGLLVVARWFPEGLSAGLAPVLRSIARWGGRIVRPQNLVS